MDSGMRAVPSLWAQLIINVIAPALLYSHLAPSFGPVKALLVIALLPAVWTIRGIVRFRSVDALALLSLGGIALSLLAFLGGGSLRSLQMREALAGAAMGGAFLVSAAIDKPLIYFIVHAHMAHDSQTNGEQLALRRNRPAFHRTMQVLTLVWGGGLVLAAVCSFVLASKLSIEHYLAVSPFLQYATMGLLALWTSWYVRQRRKKAGLARPAA